MPLCFSAYKVLVIGRSANIFGQAKPIDTTAREREMEEKIAVAKKERIE